MSWELPVLTTLILSVLGLWWIYSPPSSYQKAIVYAVLCGLTVAADPRRVLKHISAPSLDELLRFRPHVWLLNHCRMVLTLGAVVWLLHRSWQTLWKPVPDLINILGVDVPEPPDVSLAGIRPDAATLSWSRPSSNRPVQKYSIQVNGVHVGDSPGNEVAITVTGLKPDHFYNIRVVAVGPNNFQAGSPVIRLRTFGKDGKPHLGNSRLPSTFTNQDHPRDDESNAAETRKQSVPTVEAAPVLEGNAASSSDPSATGQRRNTINRRHSPSVASSDQPHTRPSTADGPEVSLEELNRKFEGIRKEIDDTLLQCGKDEQEFQQQEEELKREKERKRVALKEKEEQTAQLKASVRSTMELMRAAEKEKAKKEQLLKDRETKKSKIRDTITRLENDIERMKKDREGFESQKVELKEKRDADVGQLDESNSELQEKCTELEAELKEKGKQLQDMKAAREQLPGGDDEQWKEKDLQDQREWEAKRKELHSQLVAETKKAHHLEQHIRVLEEQLSIQHQSGLAFYNQAETLAMEYEPLETSNHSDKRLSQNSNGLPTNLSSPPNQFAIPDGFQASSGLARGGFGPGLFMDLITDGHENSESEIRANVGPLSPTAHNLLPSGIFDETFDEPEQHSPLLLDGTMDDEDPQSPDSSSHSRSLFSSPQGSSHNLPFGQYTNSDGIPRRVTTSPEAPAPSGHRFVSLLSSFQRNRAARASDEDGPPIGTLKSGQSQSFPRGTDDGELTSKRRISFSSWMNRHSAAEASHQAPVPTSRSSFSSRRRNPFTSSAGALLPDRDPENSRPASISSSDLPRPSTDSGSIWRAPGEISGLANQRFWSPNDGRWPSRSGSRRPSIHGSSSLLETTLASADDEILDETDLLDPQTSPSQVGVIGSRPPGHRASMSQRLNPAAPTFMANIFRKDKDKDSSPEKDRPKGKEKERRRDKSKEGRLKGSEAVTPSVEVPLHSDDSPSDSRLSRDTFSVHTVSVSESHESLNLDMTTSNSTGDMNPPSHKDPENVVKKLFRKGSSSKFSLSSRLGKDSSLFKKGPGSATYSERNVSADHRSSIGDLEDLGEEAAQLGRSFDSAAGSPSLGATSSRGKDTKEGRMSWRFSMKKKGKDSKDISLKEKESLDLERMTDGE